ncbi:MAG TPA: NAD(P)H-dependent oxidoreductase [Thermoanaerobaculia bacterium]
MTTIVGFSGSLRTESLNTKLLEAAASLMPDDVTFELVTIRGIPLYDGDVEEKEGSPEAVRSLKGRLAAADGLLIASPEYNHSIPGVVKNAIDWLSRPPKEIPRVFGRLPVAVIGATPGRGGTALAQAAWLPVLHALGTRAFSGRAMQVSGAGALFDTTGLKDEETRKRLATFVTEFITFARENRRHE